DLLLRDCRHDRIHILLLDHLCEFLWSLQKFRLGNKLSKVYTSRQGLEACHIRHRGRPTILPLLSTAPVFGGAGASCWENVINVAFQELGVYVNVVWVEELRVREWFEEWFWESFGKEGILVWRLVAANLCMDMLLFPEHPFQKGPIKFRY